MSKTVSKQPDVKKPAAKKSFRRKLFTGLVIAFWLIFLGIFVGLPLYIYSVSENLGGLYGGIPSFRALETTENDLSSELYSADGTLMGKYFRENRVNATFDELSPNLINALLAIEDIRFFDHAGIDPTSMGRVAIRSILLGQNAGGGSTLSQQLAKNLFRLRRDEAFEGKLHELNIGPVDMLITKTKEWITAVRLEQAYTKKEILAMYLNTIDFGSNAFGIKVASQTFFNKTPNDLDLHEAAVLAGLVQAPSRLSPVYNPENALWKRNLVIEQMVKYGYLNEQEADSVQQLPLGLDYSVENQNQGPAPYFRSVIKNFLHRWTREHGYDLYEDGLKIYTTIDSRMQEYAEQSVKQHMSDLQQKFVKEWDGQNPWVDEKNRELKGFIESEMKRTRHYKSLVERFGPGHDSIWIELRQKRPMRVFTWKGEQDTLMSSLDSLQHYKRFLQTGFMAMDPHSGAIKAWVGGIDFKYFKYDHVMQGRRQPGSTFKPFVYAVALENGYSPCYTVMDMPMSYETGGDPPTWTPQNSDGNFTGEPMTLRQAMARSVNSVTANIMSKVRPENVVDLAHRLGVESKLDPVLALALGISDVSVYEMVGAYSAFVNKGVYTQPYFVTRIEDKNGNVLYEPAPKTIEALNEETAYLMLHMLQGTTQIEGGTAMGLPRELRHNIEIGGKTGTTQNGSDGWFMGVTPELVAGAWVGGDNRSIRFRNWYSGQGARTAMPIWSNFMLKVYKDPELGLSDSTFDRPKAPLSVEINCARYNQNYGGLTSEEESDSLQQEAPKPSINPEDVEF